MNGGTSALSNGQLRINNNGGAALNGNRNGTNGNAPYHTPSRPGASSEFAAKVSPLPLPGNESPFLYPKVNYAFQGGHSTYSINDIDGR